MMYYIFTIGNVKYIRKTKNIRYSNYMELNIAITLKEFKYKLFIKKKIKTI